MRAAKITTKNKIKMSTIGGVSENETILFCLRFVEQEASNAGLKAAALEIDKAIAKIKAMDLSDELVKEYKFEDLIQGFRFLISFILLDDPKAKIQVLNLLQAMDEKNFRKQAGGS